MTLNYKYDQIAVLDKMANILYIEQYNTINQVSKHYLETLSNNDILMLIAKYYNFFNILPEKFQTQEFKLAYKLLWT